MEQELKRKLFHASGLILPLAYVFTPKLWMALFLMLLAFFTVALDTIRHYDTRIQGLVDRFFVKLMRKNEMSGTFSLSGEICDSLTESLR